jgi:flagellar L-ring protein precursor FlgH
MRASRPLILTLAAALAGCGQAPIKLTHSPEFAPVHPVVQTTRAEPTGGIFVGGQGDNWYGRGVAYQIGDTVTVLLDETTQATRQQSTTVSRESSNDVMTPGLISKLPGSRTISGLKTDGANISSDGKGETGQAASLQGSITASIIQVLANGNLVLRGEKQLALSEGTEVIQLSGTVRPADISPNNTVQSRRLANAQIAYRGTGELSNASRPGWGTRLLQNIWPF